MKRNYQVFQALCQDCLRAPVFESREEYKAAEALAFESMCECGGDLCNCDDCVETIKELDAGALGNVRGLLTTVRSWSRSEGVNYTKEHMAADIKDLQKERSELKDKNRALEKQVRKLNDEVNNALISADKERLHKEALARQLGIEFAVRGDA